MRCPGPLMASALCRLVGEIEVARAKRPRVHELQRLLIGPLPRRKTKAVRELLKGFREQASSSLSESID
jgi:hypothetical protein